MSLHSTLEWNTRLLSRVTSKSSTLAQRLARLDCFCFVCLFLFSIQQSNQYWCDIEWIHRVALSFSILTFSEKKTTRGEPVYYELVFWRLSHNIWFPPEKYHVAINWFQRYSVQWRVSYLCLWIQEKWPNNTHVFSIRNSEHNKHYLDDFRIKCLYRMKDNLSILIILGLCCPFVCKYCGNLEYFWAKKCVLII